MTTALFRPLLIGLACAALLALCGCDAATGNRSGARADADADLVKGPRDATIRILPPEAYAAALDADRDMPVIDVQVPDDGHLAGTDAAVAFDDIATASILPDDHSHPVAVYCRTGRMSAVAARTLVSMGFTEVLDLQGGLDAWEASGRPVRHDAMLPTPPP